LFVAGGEKLSFQAGRPKSKLEHMGRRGHSPGGHAIPKTGSRQKGRRPITEYLQIHVGALLETEKELVPLDHPLIGLGMDSFMSVELANRIETDFGIMISPVDILEAQSILAIAAQLHAEVDGCKQPASASTSTHKTQSFKGGKQSPAKENAVPTRDDDDWEDGYL
jgi:acyl carrier protein